MSSPIFVTGHLASTVEISPEHLEMLNGHLAENSLGEIATAVRNHDGTTSINFAFGGPGHLYMNATNFAFGENVARIVEISQELNLGLSGEVLLCQIEGYGTLSAQKITATGDGLVYLTRGSYSPVSKKPSFPSSAGELVKVRPKHY